MRERSVDVVKCLIESSGKELNILSIAKTIKMNYKNAFDIVKRLEKEKIVTLQKFGASNRVVLNSAMHPLIFQAEYSRRRELLRNKNILVMLGNIRKDAGSAMYVLLLFGSYAKKRQTAKSDIDIMFIAPDEAAKNFEKKAHQAVRTLPLPIHYLVFSETQFLDMINSKGLNVGKEAAKNNVILHGIENYYEMMQ